MQIPLLVLVLGVLIPVSGLIAWAGDRIGHKMGKKRHTLLGLRPRHTAMVFTIGSGIGISLVSFLLLWATSEQFRTVLSEGAALLTVNKKLRSDNKRLEGEVGERTKQTADARRDAQQALADRDAARQVRDTAFRESARAQGDLQRAKQDLAAAKGALTNAQNAYNATNNRLGVTTGRLTQAKQWLRTAQTRYKAAQDRVDDAIAAQNKALGVAKVAKAAADKAESDRKEIEKNAERTIEDNGKLLAEQNEKAKQQQIAFEKEVSARQAELSRLQGEVNDLQKRRDELSNELTVSKASTTALRRGQIIYRVGEEVARASISSDQTVWRIESALVKFFDGAVKEAESRGASGTNDNRTRAVLITTQVPTPSNGNSGVSTAANAILPSEEDALHQLAQTIRRSPDPVAIVLTASANAIVGEPVLVELHPYRNPVVLAEGLKLGETTINGGENMTREAAADAVYDFLRRDVRKALLTAGVIPIRTGDPDDGGSSVVNLTGNEWLKVMDDLKRTGFRARLIVKTAKALRAADPVSLAFEVKALPAPVPVVTNSATGIPARP